MLKKTGLVVVGLLLLGIGLLYRGDSVTVAMAQEVEVFILEYCDVHAAYPSAATMRGQYPDLFVHGEWFYWPNETLTGATYQYPMTLLLPHAPGKSKVSEFFPMIYAYAHRNPCSDLTAAD